MNQATIGHQPGIDNLQFTQVPQPKPHPGEVVVRVRAASLNFRDYAVITGNYGPKFASGVVPLSDGAGEVIAVGEGVTDLKAGDRVAGLFMRNWVAGGIKSEYAKSARGGEVDGMLSEFAHGPSSSFIALPANLTYEEAATLPCAALTAWQALFERNPITPGETILIQGSGGVSIFALQFAVAAGAVPIVISRSQGKLDQSKRLGAAQTILTQEVPNWDEEVFRLTDGKGVDRVIDVIGGASLNRSARAVKTGGIISLIGVLDGASGDIVTAQILRKAITIQGIYVGSGEMFGRMNRFIESANLKPVIDRTFPLEDAKAAYHHLASGDQYGKIVIKIAD